MNNAQKFIKSELDYIGENVPDSQKEYKPSIVISHGLAKTKHIAISWEQFEYITQYLIDSTMDEAIMKIYYKTQTKKESK